MAQHRKKVRKLRRDISLGALGMTTGSLLLSLSIGVLPTAAAAAGQTDVIGVGGTGDSTGTRIFDKLDGAFKNPLLFNDQGLPYSAVYYPINQSVDAAVPTLDQQITDDQGNPTVLLGYSQGTLVIVKWLKQQDSKPANPDITAIILIAAPNTPNGGIYARYPWLQGNPIAEAAGLDFNGAVPNDTPYTILIVNHKYDPYGDSPLDPLNALADLNSLAAVEEVHPDANYDNVNLTTLPPGATEQTYPNTEGGNLIVVTLADEHLPLLMPFYQTADAAGVGALAAPGLDLIEPVLTWGVELGYDRTLPADQPTPAQPGSSLAHLPGALPNLPGAIQQGVQNAVSDLGKLGPSSITTPDPSKLPPIPGASLLSTPSTTSTTPSVTSSTTDNPVVDVVTQVTKPVTTVVKSVSSALAPKSGNLFSPSTTAGSSKKPGGGNPVAGALGAVQSAAKGLAKALSGTHKPSTSSAGSSSSP